MELTPQQKNKLLALQELIRVEGDSIKVNDLAIVQKVLEFGDTIEEKINEIDTKKNEIDTRVNEALTTVNNKLSEVASGKDGKDGNDGKNGKDGKDGRDGRDGRDGADGVDGANGLNGRDGQDGKDAESVDPEEFAITIANYLDTLPEEDKISMDSIRGLNDTIATLQNRTQLLNQIATQGQRSSGGGGSALTVKDEGSTLSSAVTSIDFVGAGVTATNTGGAVTVTISTSAGAGYQSATGTVDGSNTVFTFAVAPNAIMVDGVMIRKTASDGTTNWTGTTSITLSVAPNFDIAGIA